MAERRLPGSGAAELPSDRRLWLGQTVDARVVCDGAEWIGGYGICRGEWSAAGNVADADAAAAEVSCEVTGGWREVLGDGACSTGRLRGRLAQPNEIRRCAAGFRLAVVTGDLEHSAAKGSPPRHDQRPGGGGFAVQLRVAGFEPCQLFERLQRRPRRPVPSGPRPRPAGPQPTSTGRRSSRRRRGCPIEPMTAGRRPAPPPVPSGPRAGRLPGRPPAAAGSEGPGRGPWRRGRRRAGRPAPGGTPPRIARAAAGPSHPVPAQASSQVRPIRPIPDGNQSGRRAVLREPKREPMA